MRKTITSLIAGLAIAGSTLLAPGAATAAETTSVDFSVSTTYRCVVGKAALVVTIGNEAASPLTTSVSTAFGDKTLAPLAHERSVSQAFSARVTAVPAGKVTVLASATVDGQIETAKVTVNTPAFSCN